MPRISLNGGSYSARSPVSAAERALNWIPEPLPNGTGEPVQMAHYPAPGLTLLCTLPTGPVRGIRAATNGAVYVVGGSAVYLLSTAWVAKRIGSINPGTTPVSMSDNGLQLVIVDGTYGGWTVGLADNTVAPIVDATGSFRGADRVSFLDTFFLFNAPGTPQFYTSLSLSTTFDPLYFANKESYSDLLVTQVAINRQIWLIGDRTTEVWYNTGAADFPFERVGGVFIDHGCVAKYSIGEFDNAVYWLSQDRQGAGVVLKGAGLTASRVSNFAMEDAISRYGVISDAVGWTYQMAGHPFYVLNFPTADKTWVFDVATELWHERAWIDANGAEHRHRGNCAWQANGLVAVGDWQNGNIYALDNRAFTDAGAPIKRLRVWPHLEGSDGERLFYRDFLANVSVGTLAGTMAATEPLIYLSWSDDRGVSFGNPVAAGLGAAGEYRTSVQWNRLGMARSRVFALETSAPMDVALLGAWVDAAKADS